MGGAIECIGIQGCPPAPITAVAGLRCCGQGGLGGLQTVTGRGTMQQAAAARQPAATEEHRQWCRHNQGVCGMSARIAAASSTWYCWYSSLACAQSMVGRPMKTVAEGHISLAQMDWAQTRARGDAACQRSRGERTPSLMPAVWARTRVARQQARRHRFSGPALERHASERRARAAGPRARCPRPQVRAHLVVVVLDQLDHALGGRDQEHLGWWGVHVGDGKLRRRRCAGCSAAVRGRSERQRGLMAVKKDATLRHGS